MPDKEIPLGDLLTLDEVAERLKVSWRTVNRMVNNGTLGAIRIGRVWRVPEAALKEFLVTGYHNHQQVAVA